MIKKQHLKSRPVCKLTFYVPDDVEADEVYLMGDFTDWDPVPFEQLKSGRWKFQQEVEPGQDYQFRYRIERDGDVSYRNDPDADRYVQNEFGSENAVVEV